MHILNAMFSRGSGGIEQSFADYCHALNDLRHNTSSLTLPNANINRSLPQTTTQYHAKNLGQWDLLAKSAIRKILKQSSPDIIIAHGNRAIELLQPAKKLHIPLVGVAHNYRLKHIPRCDGAFAITQDVKHHIVRRGFDKNRCFHIPNMIDISDIKASQFSAFSTPIRINSMGRFVEKKGFHLFLDALATLKQKGLSFSTLIGGDGEEKQALEAQCKRLGLQNHVTFCGWINDKDSFFDQTDIFCLPSLHEPFGIVLLEAFAHHTAVISSKTEGPSEIGTHQKDCILVTVDSSHALADALHTLANHSENAKKITLAASKTLHENYLSEIVGKKIETSLHTLLDIYD